MEQLNQVSIEEVSTRYDVKMSYHSDLMAENYDAKITLVEGPLNRITVYPMGCNSAAGSCSKYFAFDNSDPDRVIAICQMIMAAAQMVKNHNTPTIDTSVSE